MDEQVSYGVFVKMKPGIGGQEQEWRMYSPWFADYDGAMEMRNEAIRNPRFAEIVIFRRHERYEMMPDSRIGKNER